MWVTSVQSFWGLDDLLLSSPIVYPINCLCICLLMNIWIIFQFGIVTIKEHFCISLCTIRAFIALGQICTCGIAGWAGRWKPEVNLDIIPWEPSSLVLFFFSILLYVYVLLVYLYVYHVRVCWMPWNCVYGWLWTTMRVQEHQILLSAGPAVHSPPWFLRQELSLGLGLVSQLGWSGISNGLWCPSPQS